MKRRLVVVVSKDNDECTLCNSAFDDSASDARQRADEAKKSVEENSGCEMLIRIVKQPEAIRIAIEALPAYQKAINQIDDYFEYDGSNCGLAFGIDSPYARTFEDCQTKVKQILQELTNKLAHIRDAG